VGLAVLGLAPSRASSANVVAGVPAVRQWDMYNPPRGGIVDLDAVSAEVKRRLGALQACYARRLGVVSSLAGRVEIHWTIAESGKVPESCITDDTVGDAELTACVNELILGASFPPPRGGSVQVTLPFEFGAKRTHEALR
jgi:hypothetical protein